MNSRSFDPVAATGALQDYVKRKLVPFKYPRLVQFMDELPKSGTGKIDRQVLLKYTAARELSSPLRRELLGAQAERSNRATPYEGTL